MLHRNQRHVDARHGAHLACPLAGAVDDDLGSHLTLLRQHACDAPVLHCDAGDHAVLDDGRTPLPRALGERLGDVGRICLAVGRQEGGALQVADVHQRPEIPGLPGAENVHFQTERARGGGLAPELGHALAVAREPQAPVLLPARRLPGLAFQPFVERDAFRQEPGDVRIRAQLPDQPGGMEGRAAGQLGPLQQHDVAPAEPGQVIGGGAADDAAADDDDSRGRRNVCHVFCSLVTAQEWPGRSDIGAFEAIQVLPRVGHVVDVEPGVYFGDHGPHALAQQRSALHGQVAPLACRIDGPLEVTLEQPVLLCGRQLAVGGEPAEIEQRAVEAGVLPID